MGEMANLDPTCEYLGVNCAEAPVHDPFEGVYKDTRLPSERGLVPSQEWWD